MERLKAHAKETDRQLCMLCLEQKVPQVTFIKNTPGALRTHKHRMHPKQAVPLKRSKRIFKKDDLMKISRQ